MAVVRWVNRDGLPQPDSAVPPLCCLSAGVLRAGDSETSLHSAQPAAARCRAMPCPPLGHASRGLRFTSPCECCAPLAPLAAARFALRLRGLGPARPPRQGAVLGIELESAPYACIARVSHCGPAHPPRPVVRACCAD